MRVGTPASPKGAIGVIGASCETHSCLNNILTGGFAYGVYAEGLTQCGPTLVRGKLALMANYPQNPADYLNQNFQSMNLFGDPGLDIWLKPVTNTVVTYSANLYTTGGNANVTVKLADGTPVEGAWVCFTKGTDELFVSGYTDAYGVVVLPYGALTAGTVVLTVTKPQYKPYFHNIVVNAAIPTIALQDITALNQCYAGSSLSFPITLTNNSTDVLNNVTATLEIQNQEVSFINAQSSFGNIAAGASAASASNYQFSISSEISKGEAIYFNLHVTYDGGSFDIPINCIENGPDFELQNVAFSGDVLNHGANQLNISLTNNSSAPVIGLQAVLESSNPQLTITNPNQTLGTVAANATIQIPTAYALQVADLLMEGINIRLNLHLYNTNGFSQNLAIDKKVGTPTANDITGPDAYGYVLSGPGDVDSRPYSWIELDPAQGGTGTNLNFTDTDEEGSGDFSTINVPFQFRFYGRAYSQVTVCSNGFIMPGNQGSIEWMNWQIPGPMVPRPIIAPFWDDLLTDSSSKVLYKYDANMNALIVQWQGMKNKYSPNLRETFEAVLYDPAVLPTPSGDSPMLFQYKVFNNVDGGSYGIDYIDHGQYATVGIGDQTGMTGLTYTFNNQYPATAQVLTNLSTLYITTAQNYQTTPNPVLLNVLISEVTGNGNGLPDFGEQLNLNMVIKNIGLGAITESQVTLTSTDQYVTIQQGQATLASLFSNQTATTNPAFGIQIALNCPNQHLILFNLHIQNQDYVFDIPVEIAINAPQFTCTNIIISDSNNNFPEPGETVQLNFNLNNISVLPIQNVSVTINHPTGITINPPIQTLSVPANATLAVSFDVSIDNSVLQGSTIDLELHITISGIYDYTAPVSTLIGTPVTFLNTGFDDPDLSLLFAGMQNIEIAPAQYIHNTGNEAVMNLSQSGYAYMLAMPIENLDLIKTRVQFTYYNTNPDAGLQLLVTYSDTQSLPLWTSTQVTATPQVVTYDLDNIPPNAAYVSFALIAYITGDEASQTIVDDMSILVMHHAPGIITGHVSLDLHPELVSQVSIYTKYSTVPVHPDNEGNYTMTAYQGQNVLIALLDGFINPTDSLVVDVIGGQTFTNNNFSLQRLCAPLNLTYTLNGNVITLNWDLEGQALASKDKDKADKQDRTLVPDHYRVFFRCNNLNFQATSAEQTYTRTLSLNGAYEIFVEGVYEFDTGEVNSDSTNVLRFNFTPNGDDQIAPIVFALNQNSPNPFNPTTQIRFSLPEKSMTSLCIYNLKGQLVKTLINEDFAKGNHSITWNGKDDNEIAVSSGVYYYKLKWNNKEMTRKMILLK
jgi:hypothetical protein